MTERAPFSLSQPDVPILRESLWKLAAAGYSESRVRGRLGLEDLADLQWRHVPIYRSEHLSDRDALALAHSALPNSPVCSLPRKWLC
jgi:hypothetical protein